MGKRKAVTELEAPASEKEVVPVAEIAAAPQPEAKSPRRIHLFRAYAGHRSQEEVIRPGMYYEDDPVLFQQAAWLVENQYGVWLDA